MPLQRAARLALLLGGQAGRQHGVGEQQCSRLGVGQARLAVVLAVVMASSRPAKKFET